MRGISGGWKLWRRTGAPIEVRSLDGEKEKRRSAIFRKVYFAEMERSMLRRRGGDDKMVINGQEFEFDLLNADTAKVFQQGTADISAACRRAERAKDAADSIRIQCRGVMDFLDRLLGEGASSSIFGGKTSLTLCLDAFEAVIREGERQRQALFLREKAFAAGGHRGGRSSASGRKGFSRVGEPKLSSTAKKRGIPTHGGRLFPQEKVLRGTAKKRGIPTHGGRLFPQEKVLRVPRKTGFFGGNKLK
jgi:hypothetical protein